MNETYLSIEEVARLECIDYEAMKKRIQRTPTLYETKTEPRETGKPYVQVALSSLSAKARRQYQVERKAKEVQAEEELEPAPWYVDVDLNWYMDTYPQHYEKARQLADLMLTFGNYSGTDRTRFSREFANANGLSQRTLYRLSEEYLEASAWAMKMERRTGYSHEYYKVLALARRPREQNTFPTISPELQAKIENIWFDQKFRANRGTVKMLYAKLEEWCSAQECPSYQTVARYIRHLMENEGGHSAAYLAERGNREWKNQMMLKRERDTSGLAVMELVQGDEHTFDCWVEITAANGRKKAVRPKLVAWIDTRSRVVMGDVMCDEANAQVIKQSFLKMIYTYGVPEYILIDNGKDYTAKEMTGRPRTERSSTVFDTDLKGFYRACGIKDDTRSLPYQPWSKGQIERFFGGVCSRFTKWMDSYTGTLTGSKTAGKVRKDIKGMLERGELLTMDEFFAIWQDWLATDYHQREHAGLKKAGEQWTKPMELLESAEERYIQAPPPGSYAAILMMQSHRAYVSNVGIHRNHRTYMCEDLIPYIRCHVDIKYNPVDPDKLYVYTVDGRRIGEAVPVEPLGMGIRASEKQLEEHKRAQNRQLAADRSRLERWQTPFEEREPAAEKTLAGTLELTVGKKPRRKVVRLPEDEQYRQEQTASRQKKKVNTEYYDQRGQEVLDLLSKLG